jgi:hypothetical protein
MMMATKEKKNWFVYAKPEKLVLSGYPTKGGALAEAAKVSRELPKWSNPLVLPRSHPLIREYARTHPAFASRERFKKFVKNEPR